MPTKDSSAFTYSSQPHAAPFKSLSKSNQNKLSSDEKHNEDSADRVALTLMSDPRVVRGNTHSLARKLNQAKSETDNNKLSRTVEKITTDTEKKSQPSYTYEVKSFASKEIDISLYITEQRENKPKSVSVENQTNEFLSLKKEEPYVPRKTGVDRSTQVEDVAELFNFDLEVAPILEVIIDKTLEQALFEVQSEEELRCLEEVLEGFYKEKDAEDAWIKSKQEQEIFKSKEVAQKIEQLERLKESEIITKNKVAGLHMMQQLLPQIVEDISSENIQSALWKEPDKQMVESDILPFITNDCAKCTNAYAKAGDLLDELLHESESRFLAAAATPQPYRLTNNLSIRVIFKKPNETTGEEEVSTSTSPSIIMLVRVGPSDSIVSIEKRIRAEILRRKAVVASVEGGEAPPNPDSSGQPYDSSWKLLPDASAVNAKNLHKALSDSILKTITNTKGDHIAYPTSNVIALDGILFNFPLPSVVEVEIIL
eukprot:gene5743-7930_t